MTGTRIIEVPANADVIIEGCVDPHELLRDESPFGDRGKVRSAKFEVRMSQRLQRLSTFVTRHSSFPSSRHHRLPAGRQVGIPPMEDFYIGSVPRLRHETLSADLQDELPGDRGHRAEGGETLWLIKKMWRNCPECAR